MCFETFIGAIILQKKYSKQSEINIFKLLVVADCTTEYYCLRFSHFSLLLNHPGETKTLRSSGSSFVIKLSRMVFLVSLCTHLIIMTQLRFYWPFFYWSLFFLFRSVSIYAEQRTRLIKFFNLFREFRCRANELKEWSDPSCLSRIVDMTQVANKEQILLIKLKTILNDRLVQKLVKTGLHPMSSPSYFLYTSSALDFFMHCEAFHYTTNSNIGVYFDVVHQWATRKGFS